MSQVRVLVTGKDGQLASCLASISVDGLEMTALSRKEFDLTHPNQMKRVLKDTSPDVVINCAAYTNVDGAEADQVSADLVNYTGVAELAQLCQESSAKIIHISTDFVFDGTASTPYTVDHACTPVNVYGASKLRGEDALRKLLPEDSMIIRTSWLYSEFGSNFVKTMLRLIETKERFSVVNDQQGSPTYARGLAEFIIHVLLSDKFTAGTYHWSDVGVTNWFEFSREIGVQASDLGLITNKALIESISAEAFGAAAPRPSYSVLDCDSVSKAYASFTRKKWQEQLSRMLKRYPGELGNG